MILKESLTQNLGLKALSLFFATLLWFSLTAGQEGKATIMADVQLRNLSPQFALAEDAPKTVELTVSAPELILWQLKKRRLNVLLDLQAVGEGKVAFTNLERLLCLQQEVRILRLYPSIIELKVVKRVEAPRVGRSHGYGNPA